MQKDFLDVLLALSAENAEYMVVGGFALAAHGQPHPDTWLGTWLGAAAIAVVVGLWSVARKARAAGLSLRSGPARLFFLGLVPPLVAGESLAELLSDDDVDELAEELLQP